MDGLFQSAGILVLLGASILVAFLSAGAWARFRVVRVPLLCLPVGLGIVEAYLALSETNAYIANLVFGHAWFLAVGLAAPGLFLLPFRRTRLPGLCSLLSGGLLLAGFYVPIITAYALGFQWQESPVVNL